MKPETKTADAPKSTTVGAIPLKDVTTVTPIMCGQLFDDNFRPDRNVLSVELIEACGACFVRVVPRAGDTVEVPVSFCRHITRA